MVAINKAFPPPHLGEGVRVYDDRPFGLKNDEASSETSHVYATSSEVKDKHDDPEAYLPHPSTA